MTGALRQLPRAEDAADMRRLLSQRGPRGRTVVVVVETVEIRTPGIRLGQLLKLADVADDGAHAKALLAGGSVRVNGEQEARRGRQLTGGDRVDVGGRSLLVAHADPPAGDDASELHHDGARRA